MEQQDIDTILNQLNRVKQVEAPEFLLTRVQQRIYAQPLPQVSNTMRIYGLTAILLLICLNCWVTYQFLNHKKQMNLVESMNLAPTSNLYENE